MKICHVVYSFYPFDPRVRKEAEALADAGHDVDVIAVRDKGELPEEQVGNVRVFRVPMSVSRGGPLQYLFQYALFFALSFVLLMRLHVARRYRMVHVHSLPDFQVFSTLPERVVGARVVLDLHEAFPEILAARLNKATGSALVRAARLLEWVSCKYAMKVVVPTELRRDLLVQRGVPSFKIVVVMNSFDLRASPRSTNDLRARLNLDGRVVLVQAGGINAERDLETLVRAAGLLSSSRAVTLLLFGKGGEAYKDRLRQIAATTPSLDFRLEGWIPPNEAYMRVALSDVGVVTYERNPLTEIAAPHKVFEFAAAKRPLVVADLPGLRQVWDGAALFYRPSDPGDLARRITEVLEQPALAVRLSSNASKVLDSCRWEVSRDTLLSMYRELVP